MIDVNAIQILVTVLISLGTALSGAWVTYQQMNREDKKTQRNQRRELRDDLYKEIDRLNKDNGDLREQVLKWQGENLDLKSQILEMQRKIDLLMMKIPKTGQMK